MNRKLHNSISALMAAGGALVLGLVIALPAPAPSAPVAPFADARPLEFDLGPVKTRVHFDPAYVERARARSGDLARVAGRIGARAERLERDADAAALAVFATGMAGEVADLAAIASALDSPAAAEPVSTESKRKAGKAARRNRRNLVMPYFSFLPRG